MVYHLVPDYWFGLTHGLLIGVMVGYLVCRVYLGMREESEGKASNIGAPRSGEED